ncbi:hypothetical protein BDR07DRAFT_1496151 [Suillus spraguei]|nr:hypothetical protein BDR07DRAFT_1496151 [Suillus spraguei]
MSVDQEHFDNNIDMGHAPPPSCQPIVSQHSGQRIHMPTHFVDFLPGSATHLAHMLPPAWQQPLTPSPQQSNHNEPPPSIPFKTVPNEAVLYQIYPTHPSVQPNADTLESVTDALTLAGGDQIPRLSQITKGLSSKEICQDDLYAAFSNPTSGLLMAYHYSGTGQQSIAELQHLTTFIGDPLFDHHDALLFSHTRESKNINSYLQDKSNLFQEEFGWR